MSSKTVGIVVQKDLGPRAAPHAFPTPREQIDWSKADKVVLKSSKGDVVFPQWFKGHWPDPEAEQALGKVISIQEETKEPEPNAR